MATSGPPTTGNSGVPTNPLTQRESRVIPLPGGGSFTTKYSDSELAQIDAAMAQRRAESQAASAALFPPPAVAAAAEEERWKATRAAIPVAAEARQRLREAHEVRGAAEDEVIRQREVRDRARRHLARMADELDAVEKDEKQVSAEAAQALAQALATGASPPAEAEGHVERITAARRKRDQAQAAADIVETESAAVEAALTRTSRAVERAAEIVAADAWLVLSDEIDEAKAALAELTERREETGVWLSATGKVTRTTGKLVSRLLVDFAAD
jgi:hypothetical protein